MYQIVNGTEYEPRYVMTDYDVAMLNAIIEIFPNTQQLYCFFHLMQLVHKKYQHHEYYMVIVRFVRDCHWARDNNEYEEIWGYQSYSP